MGVIYNGGNAVGRAEGLEASRNRAKTAKQHEGFVGRYAEHEACAVDCGEVRGVEPAYKHSLYLPSVDFEQHPVETVFYHLDAEVGNIAGRVHGFAG